MAAIAPRMTAADAPGRQRASHHGPVRVDGLDRVLRTGRCETAAAGRAEKKRQQRGNHPAINVDDKDENVLDGVQISFVPQFFNRPARRSVVRKSFSTAANPRPAMDGRATSTSSTGCVSSFWCCRKLSRNNRRARLRAIAPPMRLLVTTPNFGLAPSGRLLQFAMRQPSASRPPCCRTRAKSRLCSSRWARPKRRRFGVAAGMNTRIKPASGVCGRRGGGWPAWPCRSCSSCGSEIHAAVCGGFSMVDTGVS
jgi:hypothetical protein